MPAFHGNDKRNDRLHHLYAIKDKKENDIFKFGISCDPIDEDKDGLSDRVREQVDWANVVVGWIRFFGVILLKKINGNTKARKKEDKKLEDYYDKHGRYPRGNRDRKRKKPPEDD